jgi:hypothetical protein
MGTALRRIGRRLNQRNKAAIPGLPSSKRSLSFAQAGEPRSCRRSAKREGGRAAKEGNLDGGLTTNIVAAAPPGAPFPRGVAAPAGDDKIFVIQLDRNPL